MTMAWLGLEEGRAGEVIACRLPLQCRNRRFTFHGETHHDI